MIIAELILELLIWFFVEFIFYGIIIGTGKLIKKIIYFIKYKVFKKRRK